jgi:hypothetical protein
MSDDSTFTGTITRLRAMNLVRDEKRLRRDEVVESVFRDPQGGHDPLGIQNQAG